MAWPSPAEVADDLQGGNPVKYFNVVMNYPSSRRAKAASFESISVLLRVFCMCSAGTYNWLHKQHAMELLGSLSDQLLLSDYTQTTD